MKEGEFSLSKKYENASLFLVTAMLYAKMDDKIIVSII